MQKQAGYPNPVVHHLPNAQLWDVLLDSTNSGRYLQILRKLSGISPEETRTIIRETLNRRVPGFASGRRTIGGTVLRTPAGKREIFLNADTWARMSPQEQKVVFEHERAHLVPVLGRSELFAHAMGGLRGTSREHPFELPKQIVHAFRTNPYKAVGETALLGGAAATPFLLKGKKKEGSDQRLFASLRRLNFIRG